MIPRIIVQFTKYNTIIVDSEQKLGVLHDELYNRMSRLMKKYNPCEIKKGSCYCFEHTHKLNPFCCSGCKHQGGKGCNIKSLVCKFHLCSEMMYHRSNNNPLPDTFFRRYSELRRIRKAFFINSSSGMRLTKEDYVKSSWEQGFGLHINSKNYYHTY